MASASKPALPRRAVRRSHKTEVNNVLLIFYLRWLPRKHRAPRPSAHVTTTAMGPIYSRGPKSLCPSAPAVLPAARAADIFRPRHGTRRRILRDIKGDKKHGQGRRSGGTPEILHRAHREVGGRARRDIRRHPRGLCRGEIRGL